MDYESLVHSEISFICVIYIFLNYFIMINDTIICCAILMFIIVIIKSEWSYKNCWKNVYINWLHFITYLLSLSSLLLLLLVVVLVEDILSYL